MNLKNKIQLFVFIISLVINACTTSKKNDKFLNYLNKHKIDIVSKYVVISERHCFTCNKHFYNLTKQLLKDTSVIFIVTAEGGLLDTRIYENHKNVYWDYDKDIEKMNIIKTSGIIKLKNNKEAIDTIIAISPINIEETFEKLIKSP